MRKGRSFFALFFVFFLINLSSFPAQSSEKSRWALGVGFGWLHDYPAAAQGRFRFLPFPIFRGTFFRMDRLDGISGQVYKNQRHKFSWSFIFNFPTESAEIPVREGMPDLDWLLSLGPQIKSTIWRTRNHHLFFRFPVRVNSCTNFYSRTQFCGLTFNPGVRHRIIGTGIGNFTIRAEAFAVSREYAEYYYEVPSIYATPTRPAYHAKSGYLGVVLGAIHEIVFEGWGVMTALNIYDYGNSPNDDSPLWRQRTNWGIFSAVTIDL